MTDLTGQISNAIALEKVLKGIDSAAETWYDGYVRENEIILQENSMADTVAQMTKEELREMIEASVEQKLLEILGDPDEDSPPPGCCC
jgi:predicted RNase H-like HicB family nuclease